MTSPIRWGKATARARELERGIVKGLTVSRFPSWVQLSFLPRLLNKNQKRVLAGAVLLFFVSGVSLFWRSTTRFRTQVPTLGGTLTEAIVGAPKSLNPLFATLNAADGDITRLIYPGLVTTDFRDPRTFVPTLAEHIGVSDDGRTYTVTLRSDIHWHDGMPLVADDVLFTIERIQAPETKSPLAPSFSGVVAAKLNDHAFTLTLLKPVSSFLASLTFGVLPKHRWANRTHWLEHDPELIGSGPFRFGSLQQNADGTLSAITLMANRTGPLTAWIEKLVFRFFTTPSDAHDAFLRGKTDAILVNNDEQNETLLASEAKNHTVMTLAIPQYTAVFFNPREQPIFTDAALRRALAAALPKQELVASAFGNHAEIASGPFAPRIFSVPTPPETPPLDGGRLLDQAGWRLTNGIRVNNQKKVLRFTLTTSDAPAFLRLAQAMADHWRGLGAQIDIRTVESARLLSDVIRPRAYDALLTGQNLGADPDPFPFWHSSQEDDPGLNFALFRNARADEIMDQARAISDPAARRKLYAELTNILQNEAPAIFIAYPTVRYMVPKNLKNITLTAIAVPADRFAGVTQWYIKTKSQWHW